MNRGPLTLDETIVQAENRGLSGGIRADHHMQLAQWLTELKHFRSAVQTFSEPPHYCNGFDDLDPECRRLCAAMNALPGIRTIESCCGHGEEDYRVFFMAADLQRLMRALQYLDGLYDAPKGWYVRACWNSNAGTTPTFILIGPPSERCFAEADRIAESLEREASNPVP